MSAFLRIQCCSCNENQRISFNNLALREKLECFNCQTPMPDNLLQPLKVVAQNYLEAQKNTAVSSDSPYNTKHWGFEVVYSN